MWTAFCNTSDNIIFKHWTKTNRRSILPRYSGDEYISVASDRISQGLNVKFTFENPRWWKPTEWMEDQTVKELKNNKYGTLQEHYIM